MTSKREISRLTAALKKKIEGLDEQIEGLDEQIQKVREKRLLLTRDLAGLIAEYQPGDVLKKGGRNAGLWLVEEAGSNSWGDLSEYCLHVRKLKKDGTPSKVTARFDSRWELKGCMLVERRKP